MFTEFVRGKIANKTKNAAIKVATHYANVACPFFTYQPKMSAEVIPIMILISVLMQVILV